MDCEQCRGACCEEFEIPFRDLPKLPNRDIFRWFLLHGEVAQEAGAFRLECRCTKLTEDGRCGIYETRPNVCRVFEPGGEDCLDTLRRRRTRQQYEQIRGDGDPEAEMLYGE